MGKVNGKSEAKECDGLDLEHELPAASEDETADCAEAASGESSAPESELQKLKAERDSLLDRLARAQAEFENARRRVSKEQQEFRDYAVADAIKTFAAGARQPGARPAGEIGRGGIAQRSRTDLQATAGCAGQAVGASDCGEGRSRSIPIITRPSKWWKPPTLPIIR